MGWAASGPACRQTRARTGQTKFAKNVSGQVAAGRRRAERRAIARIRELHMGRAARQVNEILGHRARRWRPASPPPPAEQPDHQRINALHHAGLGQRVTDEPPRTLEFHAFGQFHKCSDPLGLGRHQRKIGMQPLPCFESWDREVAHDLVEIAGAPLTSRLILCCARTSDLAIEYGCQILTFRLGLGRHPI